MNEQKYEKTTNLQKHQITIDQRNALAIEGVKELDSFDNEEFLLETQLGYLVVRGKDLQLKNLNVEAGIVEIAGTIDALTYIDEQSNKDKAKGIMNRLFR